MESARLFAPSSNLTTTQKEQLTRARYLQIYSCGQPDSSLATKLSAQLIECNSEHEQQKLALCYEPLPSLICDDNFEFKDKLSYLAVVFAILIVINFICQLYVMPVYTEVFNDYHVQLNNSLRFITQFGYVFILLLGGFLAITWLSAKRLSQIGNLDKTDTSSSMIDFIIPKKIKLQYVTLITIFEFPVTNSKGSADIPEFDHL